MEMLTLRDNKDLLIKIVFLQHKNLVQKVLPVAKKKKSASKNIYNPLGTFDSYCSDTTDVILGTWRSEYCNQPVLANLPRIPRKIALHAQHVRNVLKGYFMTPEGKSVRRNYEPIAAVNKTHLWKSKHETSISSISSASFRHRYNQSRIEKRSLYRECISARDKLIITLRYLATGEHFRILMYCYRVHESTISLFVPIVCKAIYEELKPNYLKVGTILFPVLVLSGLKFLETELQWNIPNTVGALDGKDICINAPGNEARHFIIIKANIV
ncbi:hypothetical protein NQ317_017232 [Molorchus minor]|uniref:Uncharacterized protein n=1 Tax=Molorchus minor TaxID=1323400 RepID=A0ABQ9JGB9_9CUCU|nr:hypothetical protein NQ317_017232 [Molorchus minor]